MMATPTILIIIVLYIFITDKAGVTDW